MPDWILTYLLAILFFALLPVVILLVIREGPDTLASHEQPEGGRQAEIVAAKPDKTTYGVLAGIMLLFLALTFLRYR